jgi:hypothetical protein
MQLYSRWPKSIYQKYINCIEITRYFIYFDNKMNIFSWISILLCTAVVPHNNWSIYPTREIELSAAKECMQIKMVSVFIEMSRSKYQLSREILPLPNFWEKMSIPQMFTFWSLWNQSLNSCRWMNIRLNYLPESFLRECTNTFCCFWLKSVKVIEKFVPFFCTGHFSLKGDSIFLLNY